jgi:hypothetical protein
MSTQTAAVVTAMVMTQLEAEAKLTEFLEREFENSDKESDSFTLLRNEIERGRVVVGDGELTYKPKFPVGDVTEITFKTRTQVSKALNISAKDEPSVQALKIIEAYSRVPVVIIRQMDVFDLKRISAIMFFFA